MTGTAFERAVEAAWGGSDPDYHEEWTVAWGLY